MANQAMEELARWALLDETYGKALKELHTGAVIRFTRTYEEDGKEYSFAALKVIGGLWYLTKATNSRVLSPLKHDDFLLFLEAATDVEVAMSWQALQEVGLV
jgi:hypothetical protein